LGMAAFQTRAVQGSQSSIQRSQAIMLGYNMLDAMRIDRDQAANGSYNITKVADGGISASSTLANNNLRAWLAASKKNLGGGASPVYGTINCTAQFLCTVTIEWDDSKVGGLPDQKITIQATV
jgi:type IV pilus assembly protein PilV